MKKSNYKAKKAATADSDLSSEILLDMYILELLKAGMKQHDVRRLASCDLARVVRVSKPLTAANKRLSKSAARNK